MGESASSEMKTSAPYWRAISPISSILPRPKYRLGVGEAFQLGQRFLDLPPPLRRPSDRRDHRPLAPATSIDLHRLTIILSTSAAAPAGPPTSSMSIQRI